MTTDEQPDYLESLARRVRVLEARDAQREQVALEAILGVGSASRMGADEMRVPSLGEGAYFPELHIAAKSITAAEIAAGSITAEKIAVGALYGNLLLNGSFEDGTADIRAGYVTDSNLAPGWTINGAAKAQFPANTGAKGKYWCLVQSTDGATTAARVEQFIPVIAGRRYRLVGWMQHGATAGNSIAPRMHVSTYDRDLVQVAGSFSGVTHSPATSTTLTQYGVEFTIPSDGTVAWIRVDCRFNGIAALNEIAAFDDVSLTLVADTLANSSAEVTIDSTGVTVLNGKITLQDQYGKSSLFASGFQGAWDDYASTHLYNGSFTQNATQTGATLGETAHCPYWTLAQTSGSPTFDTSPGALLWKLPSNTNGGSATSDKVRVRSGVRLSFILSEYVTNLDARTINRTLRIKTYDGSGAFLANVDLETRSLIGGGVGPIANVTPAYTPDIGVWGSAVQYIAVEVRVAKTDAAIGTTTYALMEVSILEQPQIRAVSLVSASDLTLTTTYTDVPDLTTTRDKGRDYLVIATLDLEMSVAGTGALTGRLLVDGSVITSPILVASNPTATTRDQPSQSYVVSTSPAGSGIIKLQAAKGINAGTARCVSGRCTLTVIPL